MNRPSNQRDVRGRCVDMAQRCLTKAAAALLEYPLEKNALSFALLMTATALYAIVQADMDETARNKVETYLEHLKAEREGA